MFLTDVRIPDQDRIGPVGEGWKVANATLMSERVNIGASRAGPRESFCSSKAYQYYSDCTPNITRNRVKEDNQRLASLSERRLNDRSQARIVRG